MSFVLNNDQQISVFDDLFSITERERKRLEHTWAIPFAERIFPAIDERPYSVLYSSIDSRPNTPVNVIIGALILKELLGLTDEGIMDALMFDVRFRVALHTTSFDEQPISDRTLSRFRARCLSWQESTGVDLLHNTIISLAEEIARIVGTDNTLMRMDSMMISSNIKRLSRTELVYKCTREQIRSMQKHNVSIPADLTHYLEPGDYNRVFYHEKDREKRILEEAERVLEVSGPVDHSLLERVLSEQTEQLPDGRRTFRKPGDKSMHSECIQSPYDRDASFRNKGRQDHIGYIANVVEVCGTDTSVVIDYQYEKNTYSDSQFLKDTVRRTKKSAGKKTLVTDGGYSGIENRRLSDANGIQLITTNMTGRKTASYADFRKTDTFKRYSAFRNGVETVPSVLRRKYNIDHMPVRGKLRTAFYFGCKLAAMNFRKLCIHLQSVKLMHKNWNYETE